jgi:glycosyltransferase involved in cell wall biosynthesis
MDRPNVYFVVSHPIQYIVPLYKHLAQDPRIHTKVLFLSDETLKGAVDKQFGVKVEWDIPLLEGYEYTFVKNKSWSPSLFNGFWGLFNPGIIGLLWRLPKGMVVVNGWHFSTYVISYIFAFLFGHAVAIRCEAPGYKEMDRKGLRNKVRSFLIGRVLLHGLIDKCLYLGKQSKAFYQHFHVRESKLFFSPYTIDNKRFAEGAGQYNREEERLKLGIEKDDFVILFTGKFIPVKRPLDLVKAYHGLDVRNKRLLLVGDGILKEEILTYIAEHKIDGVHLAGFINQTELPKYYALADVLVLCSESETWGLSVNEAMACGVPVIVSDRVGCAEDLVKNGQNGYIFPKGNVEALTVALADVSSQIGGSNSMGLASRRIISEYTFESAAEGIIEAAKRSLQK